MSGNFQKYIKVEEGDTKLACDVKLDGVTLKKGAIMKIVGLSHGGFVLLESRKSQRFWVHPSKMQ